MQQTGTLCPQLYGVSTSAEEARREGLSLQNVWNSQPWTQSPNVGSYWMLSHDCEEEPGTTRGHQVGAQLS